LNPYKEFQDFEYKKFKCTVVKYQQEKPNLSISKSFDSDPYWNGWWCGYVVIPQDHKFHGKHYDNIPIDAHGGLTYASKFHLKDSKNYNKFVVGFDFLHAFDNGGTKEIVIQECKQIVDQLK